MLCICVALVALSFVIQKVSLVNSIKNPRLSKYQLDSRSLKEQEAYLAALQVSDEAEGPYPLDKLEAEETKDGTLISVGQVAEGARMATVLA